MDYKSSLLKRKKIRTGNFFSWQAVRRRQFRSCVNAPDWETGGIMFLQLDEPDTQDTAGEARTNSSVMYSCGPPHMAKQKQDDQLEHTYSSYVRIRDVALKTCQKRWMIGRSGERGSGISVLAARHDDEDDCRQNAIFNFCPLYKPDIDPISSP